MPSLWRCLPGWSSFWPSYRRLLYYWYCLPSRALPADSLYFHWAAQSPQQCRCAGLPVLQHSAGQVQVLGGDTSNTGAANGSLLGAKTDRSQILLAKPRVLVARVRISDWRKSLLPLTDPKTFKPLYSVLVIVVGDGWQQTMRPSSPNFVSDAPHSSPTTENESRVIHKSSLIAFFQF